MSFLMMNCSTLEQAPWGVVSSQSSERNMQTTGLQESVPEQTGESTRASPGRFLALVYVNPFLQAYWAHKLLLCVIPLIKAQSMFSLIHIFGIIKVKKIEKAGERILLNAM